MMPVSVAGPDRDKECYPGQIDIFECVLRNWSKSWIFIKQAYFFEAIATSKHILPYSGNGVWNLDICKAIATIKSGISEAGDRTRDLYSVQAGAF